MRAASARGGLVRVRLPVLRSGVIALLSACGGNQPLADLVPGSEATLLVLDRDPRTDATALLEPRGVYLRGQRLR